MTKDAIQQETLERIRKIHRLSSQYNQRVGKEHQQRLLELMRSHVDEIEDLTDQKDPHMLVETGDLMMLCFEMLLEHRADPVDILERCCARYEKKLSELLEGFQNKNEAESP